ncbi:hypothetical protein QBC46DRAFT_406046 [Diplogelasinospora grovesii]|uniref:Uncharacterized protein n=1 Tax=Diplogelasinospora grovesii TaxID=303347 RepID=A0AAN6NC44_9PEZI|nr:hypothetical protein QBC46DRAFT_406046 [Diplogelasinospora grovesii]
MPILIDGAVLPTDGERRLGEGDLIILKKGDLIKVDAKTMTYLAFFVSNPPDRSAPPQPSPQPSPQQLLQPSTPEQQLQQLQLQLQELQRQRQERLQLQQLQLQQLQLQQLQQQQLLLQQQQQLLQQMHDALKGVASLQEKRLELERQRQQIQQRQQQQLLQQQQVHEASKGVDLLLREKRLELQQQLWPLVFEL